MVTQAFQRDLRVFRAISDPIRREILDILRSKDLPAGEIAERFPVSRPAISRHLRVLRGAGLVTENRVAQARIYSLNPAPLAQIDRWLAEYRVFWAARLHDLKDFVESEEME